MTNEEYLALFKSYNRLDFLSEDDENELLWMIETAKEYIEGAIGEFDDTSKRVQRLVLSLTHDFYSQRGYTQDKEYKKSCISKSIIRQLQLERMHKSYL